MRFYCNQKKDEEEAQEASMDAESASARGRIPLYAEAATTHPDRPRTALWTVRLLDGPPDDGCSLEKTLTTSRAIPASAAVDGASHLPPTNSRYFANGLLRYKAGARYEVGVSKVRSWYRPNKAPEPQTIEVWRRIRLVVYIDPAVVGYDLSTLQTFVAKSLQPARIDVVWTALRFTASPSDAALPELPSCRSDFQIIVSPLKVKAADAPVANPWLNGRADDEELPKIHLALMHRWTGDWQPVDFARTPPGAAVAGPRRLVGEAQKPQGELSYKVSCSTKILLKLPVEHYMLQSDKSGTKSRHWVKLTDGSPLATWCAKYGNHGLKLIVDSGSRSYDLAFDEKKGGWHVGQNYCDLQQECQFTLQISRTDLPSEVVSDQAGKVKVYVRYEHLPPPMSAELSQAGAKSQDDYELTVSLKVKPPYLGQTVGNHIGISASSIRERHTDAYFESALQRTVLHEVIHALGGVAPGHPHYHGEEGGGASTGIIGHCSSNCVPKHRVLADLAEDDPRRAAGIADHHYVPQRARGENATKQCVMYHTGLPGMLHDTDLCADCVTQLRHLDLDLVSLNKAYTSKKSS